MIFLRRALIPLAFLASPVLAQDAPPTEAAQNAPSWDPTLWDLTESEFAPEAAWRFGRLDNGLRYIIRRNDRPENTALVRMEIAAGSLDERDDERGTGTEGEEGARGHPRRLSGRGRGAKGG